MVNRLKVVKTIAYRIIPFHIFLLIIKSGSFQTQLFGSLLTLRNFVLSGTGFNHGIITSSRYRCFNCFFPSSLYAGVKEGAEQIALENFVSLFRVIPVTAEIAKAGGFYKRDYGKSHGVDTCYQ